jgi:NitT/TauT family transport system ATP-binding protein
MHESIIEIRNLQFGYGEGPSIVRVEELKFKRNTIVSILGPSGCGKTTFLLILGGLLNPNSDAHIRIAGVGVLDAVKRGLISISFQAPVLVPWRTAIGNVSLPLELKDKRRGVFEIQEALDKVNLSGTVQNYYPRELSSGMRSRVAVAQAMVTGASVLLMDEVFGTLDEATRVRMNLMLRRINSTEMNATILFVTHSIDEALLLGDRVIVFRKPNDRRMSSVSDDISVVLPERTSSTRYSNAFRILRERLEKLFLEEE